MANKQKEVAPLAKKLRMALAELGSNQTEIAKKMGVSKAQISHWVSGDNTPSMESLTKLARAIGKPVNYFFENSGTIANADNKSNISFSTDDKNRITLLEKDIELIKKTQENFDLRLRLLEIEKNKK